MSRILFLIILIAGLILGIYLVSQTTSLFSRADISTVPQEIKVTNISDNSFTVSWITEKPATGFLQYGGSEQLGDSIPDDRDTGVQQSHTTHHVTIKNLDPGTVYYYKITSGTENFDDRGKSFTQTTAPTTENPPAPPEPIFGKVVKQDGNTSTEAVVYLEINGSLLSSFVREDGNWLITLNNARTKDLLSYITVEKSNQVHLIVQGGAEGLVKMTAKVGEQDAFSKIVLPAQEFSGGGIRDLNRDGVINVFDYVLHYFF